MLNRRTAKHARPGRLSRGFKRLRSREWLFRSVVAVVAIIVILVALGGAVSIWPDFGAKGAAALRVVIGDRAAAAVEGFFLGVQDWFHRAEYALGLGHAENPWESEEEATSSTVPATSSTTTTRPVQTGPDAGGTTTTSSSTTTTTTEPPWIPKPVAAMGTLENEGEWAPYVMDGQQEVISYRTVLQPDKKRGFALAAIVAFDCRRARLHFVIGTKEPVSDEKIPRTGKIPKASLAPGNILGAFNGGFQAKHGRFGAMAEGVVALPPRDGLGTLVIYKDGRLDMGIWGTDINPSPDMESWRQNGPMLISHGEINPHTEDNAPEDWGFGLKGAVATWRTAVGLSRDRRSFYFVVGPSLTVNALARAMHQAGIWDAIQLDINKSWTRFDKATFKDGKLIAVPVLPDIIQDNRLYETYSRDFFYLTALEAVAPSP